MAGQKDLSTFEVLRHRLWAINDEAGAAVKRISGSPIATEAMDFNTGIMTAGGDLCVVGIYITSHASVQDLVVKSILKDYAENPGIHEDDMFLTNDPYYGALHQPDVTCVAPIHSKGELVAWCGCTIHQIDMGGPVPGGFAVGARSIYEEAPPIPPIKVVEGGVLRKDIEREYLRRSRTAEMVALDLRAKIAANNVTKERIKGLIARYGLDTFKALLQQMIDHAERHFRRRLEVLPDGIWRHISYIEHDGVEDKVYPIGLELIKKGDTLAFDYRASAPQAPALINCCYGGLRGAVMGAALPMLCYDIPWTPAGLWRAVEVISCPGTIVDASWPAGTSMSTLAACWAARTAANVCIGKMLGASDQLKDQAMAAWEGSLPGLTLHGLDQRGQVFSIQMTDQVAGGTGARSHKDGIDNGGIISALGMAIANVEVNEYFYPILYLYRRGLPNSGGPGMFRGGNGGEHAFVVYGTKEELNCSLFSHGVEQPASAGIYGGLPGGTVQFEIKRNADVFDRLDGRFLTLSLDELGGQVEVPPAKMKTRLAVGDVVRCAYPGGGGFGDALDRSPELVAQDVADGLISPDVAEHTYGVVIHGPVHAESPELFKGLRLLKRETDARRSAIRDERRQSARPGRICPPLIAVQDDLTRAPIRLGPYLVQVSPGPGDASGTSYLLCRKCGHLLSPSKEKYKDYALMAELPLGCAGPQVDPHRVGRRFSIRHYYCPGCTTLLETEVALKESPYLWDSQILA